ncbi:MULTISPECIES: hypothetical protein [unclassified Staphylococcus]|nr:MULTISPECIES: hypothetical protein [unclassified Staphylococcus]UXR71243.1 hypothetical protein MUA88_08670 [Staphylococcus sp. IVB6240]UXR73518.1 hypothetical protein MUA48_09160 [Staphylococcus sp. IVB6238]UXR75836.1 hypothetical protein MUA74_09240 [Staphylococcus sp. IVB6233]UXR80034.1 hypothetical protein MUA65_08845 [Staphylococcus sp. IVB6218]
MFFKDLGVNLEKGEKRSFFILKLKKSFGTLVMSAVLLSTISPFADAKESNIKNESSTTTANSNNQAKYVTVDGVKINRNPNLPVNPEVQNRIGATKVVKTAIKLIIKVKQLVW